MRPCHLFTYLHTLTLACSVAALTPAALALQEATRGSVHRQQQLELAGELDRRSDDAAKAEAQANRLRAGRGTAHHRAFPGPGALAAATRIDDDFVVFGYLQSESQVYHLRWHALTHVGSRFVGFNAFGQLTNTGAFTGRSNYLKAGGAAESAGVKVVLVLANFDDGPGGSLETVMTSAARRATLVQGLVGLLASDGYSHGVSIDFEFSWGPAVRDGITAFMQELRAGLDTLGPGYELSIYTHAIYSSSQWNFDASTGITPTIDYMLYSMYDWASGSTAHAISDLDNCLNASGMQAYLEDGLPPEKLVPVISAYSRRWSGISNYNAAGSSPVSGGFTDGHFDVTLNPAIGPLAEQYVTGDEGAWYTWNSGVQRVRTFDSLESMAIKVRHALSFRDVGTPWAGRRLGGVGFWSLLWMAELDSIDPRTGGAVARTRTYPHIYQLCHEALSPPGTERFVLDSFAGLDFRWRDPNESPDTAGDFDQDSSRALVPAPAGGDGNALRLAFDFEGAQGNRAVLAHEVLASPLAPGIADLNATLGSVPRGSRFVVPVRSTTTANGYTVRLLAIDALGQLEASPPFPLSAPTWQALTWDLSDPLAVQAVATSEPAFTSGNGVLDTGPAGDSRVHFYGLLVEGDGPAQGSLIVDEISYERADPDGRRYRINEFRYADPDAEFVEISGPVGLTPPGLTLRVYDPIDGSVQAQYAVGLLIPNLGGGTGVLALGDPGVPGVLQPAGFSVGVDDLPNADPSALQLVDVFSGHVYDSVVYEAFGGLADLTRRETLGVTSRGRPWLGELAEGRDANGQDYTYGRFPDGRDTRRNHEDFRIQVASPGARNAPTLALPAFLDFESQLPTGLQTFEAIRRWSPPASGLPASSNGGLAWRCVDATGGGVIGTLGDPDLGRLRGHAVTGEVYVPTILAPAQAIAVGVCGGHGSRFFSGTAGARSNYETGYWLIYETQGGVGLADGRPDHPGTWELVHASHDHQDGAPVELLATATGASLGIAPGSWTNFEFQVRPDAPAGQRLIVSVNGQELFRGDLPAGGPRSGCFQVGFRENHLGPPRSSEGTWIDGIRIEQK